MCGAEQFHSDANSEAVNWRTPKNLKNCQWTKENDVSDRKIDTCSAWRWVSIQLLPGSWQQVGLLLQVMKASSIRGRLLHHGLRIRMPLYKISLSANHRCLRLQGALIGTKLSFQMKHASIFGIMMAAFVLDVMPIKAAFQSAYRA